MSIYEDALKKRIAVVQRTLGVEHAADDPEGHSALDMICAVIDQVRESRDAASAWLLIVGIAAAYPEESLVRATVRRCELVDSENVALWLLRSCEELAMRHGRADAKLTVVTDRPLVDVNFTAKSDFLTGIQRVVRSTASRWSSRHDVEIVAWNALDGAYRFLHADERARILSEEAVAYVADDLSNAPEDAEIVVPWRVPLVLLEVPSERQSRWLATMGAIGVTSLRVVGYDCIPVASAEMVGIEAPGRFGLYLELVKQSDRVAGISRTAADEFVGFASALSAQGVTGPVVSACPLPTSTTVPGAVEAVSTPKRPVVVCFGSITRRKNQSSLVVAAELLWRAGLDFELRLLGHMGGEPMPLKRMVPELKRLGRHISVERGVSDARIAESLAEARCLVFPSLHEGFGLPIVEALSAGVPVITSDFGSMREVAEGQGGLLVAPMDVDALAEAMRTLLTDDAEHARLVAEAHARPVRTWHEYAADLWKELVA